MRYQSNRPKRQFLAGVKCPKCDAMDSIVQVQIFEPQADEYIECTLCGHQERRPTPDDLPMIQAQNHDDEHDVVGIVKFKL